MPCMVAGCSDAPVEQKMLAMRAAIKSHSGVIKQCAVAQGIDRHFFALKSMASQEGFGAPLPPLFDDTAFKTLGTTIISTSNCGNPSLRIFGFGPVTPGGVRRRQQPARSAQ